MAFSNACVGTRAPFQRSQQPQPQPLIMNSPIHRLASYADTARAKALARSPCFAEDVHEVHRRYKAVKEVWHSTEVVSKRMSVYVGGVTGWRVCCLTPP